jgi:hypothetical protein
MTNLFKADTTQTQGLASHYDTPFVTGPGMCELYTPSTAANGDKTFTRSSWTPPQPYLLTCVTVLARARTVTTWESQGQPDFPVVVGPAEGSSIGASGSTATLSVSTTPGSPDVTRWSYVYSQDPNFKTGTQLKEGTPDSPGSNTFTTNALTSGTWWVHGVLSDRNLRGWWAFTS